MATYLYTIKQDRGPALLWENSKVSGNEVGNRKALSADEFYNDVDHPNSGLVFCGHHNLLLLCTHFGRRWRHRRLDWMFALCRRLPGGFAWRDGGYLAMDRVMCAWLLLRFIGYLPYLACDATVDRRRLAIGVSGSWLLCICNCSPAQGKQRCGQIIWWRWCGVERKARCEQRRVRMSVVQFDPLSMIWICFYQLWEIVWRM